MATPAGEHNRPDQIGQDPAGARAERRCQPMPTGSLNVEGPLATGAGVLPWSTPKPRQRAESLRDLGVIQWCPLVLLPDGGERFVQVARPVPRELTGATNSSPIRVDENRDGSSRRGHMVLRACIDSWSEWRDAEFRPVAGVPPHEVRELRMTF
jgi:hypothetical protein